MISAILGFFVPATRVLYAACLLFGDSVVQFLSRFFVFIGYLFYIYR